MSDIRIETLVIGGGQAGLSVGYELAGRGRSFQVLDANERVGDAWRKRWDSLRLFTPARFNGLPGMNFPAAPSDFVTKDQMATFLEEYAAHFQIPVRSGARVERLTRGPDGYRAQVGEDVYVADHVVVAMSNYQKPRVPAFAAELDADVTQLHSSAYKNPSQLRDGAVLLVGAGNSGADLAIELAANRTTYLAGNDVGQIPFRIETPFAFHLGIPTVRFIGHHVLNLHTPVGRKVRPKFLKQTNPRVRVKTQDLVDAGVRLVPRVAGIADGRPVLEGGEALDVTNVVWCTGYTAGFEWIELPIFDDDGLPRHHRGIVEDHPGLYFVGLHFQHAATSDTVTGVPRDAAYVVSHLHRHASALPNGAPMPATAGG